MEQCAPPAKSSMRGSILPIVNMDIATQQCLCANGLDAPLLPVSGGPRKPGFAHKSGHLTEKCVTCVCMRAPFARQFERKQQGIPPFWRSLYLNNAHVLGELHIQLQRVAWMVGANSERSSGIRGVLCEFLTPIFMS